MAYTNTNEDHLGHWLVTADKSGTYDFATGGKYVDRNIDIVIPQAEFDTLSTTGTGEITTLTIGSKSSNKYPITSADTISSYSANLKVKTKGFTDATSYTIDTTTKTKVNSSLDAAALTVTGSATVLPNNVTAADGNAKVVNTTTSTSIPKSGYYIGITPSTAASTTITQTKSDFSAGYLGANTEVTTSGSVTGGDGAKRYVTIQSGSIATTDTDPGTSYTANTSAIVPTGGYLKIDEGYYPNTKISLATLVPDSYEGVPFASSNQMLSGYMAWDKDGAAITGSINSKSSTDLTVTGDTVTVPAGYYSTQATKKVSAGSVNSLSITDSDSVVTVDTEHGTAYYYPVNVSSLSGTVNITDGYISGNKSVSDADGGQVGKVAVSNVIAGSTDTPSSTPEVLPYDSLIKIGEGYTTTKYYKTPILPTYTQEGTTGDLTFVKNYYAGISNLADPVIYDSCPFEGRAINITGLGTMTTGNVYNGQANGKTQYMMYYTGDYSVS